MTNGMENTATHNSTLVKWRGSRQICKSQFHSQLRGRLTVCGFECRHFTKLQHVIANGRTTPQISLTSQ